MSSPSRTAWQKLKAQLEPAFGKDWVQKNFKNDLGPTFDKICDDIAEYKKLSEDAAKMAIKANELAKSIRKQHTEIHGITSTYEDLVIAKSKEKKTQHGTQIGQIMQMMKTHYCQPHITALATFDKAIKALTPVNSLYIK